MNNLVFQSDFGLLDGAVSAMVGVALNEDSKLKIHHITHDVPVYNIFEGSYRLLQTVPYWPKGTVFVSVVDPGVGTSREAVVVKTSLGHYIVTPNNGSLTHIMEDMEITDARLINVRRPKSEESHTFHGRDIFALAGAMIASDETNFKNIGPSFELTSLKKLPLYKNETFDDSVLGSIESLDVRFGSLWTSIKEEVFANLDIGLYESVDVSIYNSRYLVYQQVLPFVRSFGDVPIGASMVYLNSMNRIGIAINQGSFAKAYGIGTGHQWEIKLAKISTNKQQ